MLQNAIVFLVAFFLVNALSVLIARNIRKHLNRRVAAFTFLFVAAIAVYYLVEALLAQDRLFENVYFYLWASIIIMQALLYHRYTTNFKSGANSDSR